MASPSPSKKKDSVSVSASSLLSSSAPIPSRSNPKTRNFMSPTISAVSKINPAHFSRRNSISRVEFGWDKENQNDKDHQFSDVVKAPKVAKKNFMSPTISAVSKINPKKVLSDVNHDRINGEDKDPEQICIDEKKQLLEHKDDSHDITVTDFVESHENKKSNGDFAVPYTFPVVGESIEEEETQTISKQSRFKISKLLLGWVLALGVAYLLLVTFPQPSIIKDSPFYPEITKSARESFEQLSEMLAGEEDGYGAALTLVAT